MGVSGDTEALHQDTVLLVNALHRIDGFIDSFLGTEGDSPEGVIPEFPGKRPFTFRAGSLRDILTRDPLRLRKGCP